MATKKIIYVAHDIEKTGCQLIKHPIISVGFFVGDEHGKKITARKFNIAVNWYKEKNDKVIDYGDFEQRCVDTFWLKLDKNIINSCLLNPDPQPAQKVWVDIAKFLDELEEVFPETEYNIKFLTDNASFDTASIDYALEKYCNRRPMRYSSTGKYRSIICVDDMFEMLETSIQNDIYKCINKLVTHDHDPINDAYFIYLLYIHTLKFKPIQCIYS